uniref:Uncharacterized protein n=1 Tax=Kalanchoe fedtschenkoi TaxID=63787 RepID=A0A7N0TC54_KALFE
MLFLLIIPSTSLCMSLMVQQDKEFSMQNEDSPPLPSSASYSLGMHNVQSGSVNMANMGATSPSRNTMLSSISSSGIQPPSGNVTIGRSAASNVPIPRSQVPHGSSHGYSAATNRGVIGIPGRPGYSSNKNSVGGSIPGIIPTSTSAANWSSKLGLGVSPIQCNAGDRIHSSMGKMAGGGNIEGSISSSGGLSRPGLGSWSNTIGSGGVGSSSGQAQSKLPSEVLQQGTDRFTLSVSPVVISTSGNSYPDGAQQPLSQNSVTSMGMLGDVNNNERFFTETWQESYCSTGSRFQHPERRLQRIIL